MPIAKIAAFLDMVSEREIIVIEASFLFSLRRRRKPGEMGETAVFFVLLTGRKPIQDATALLQGEVLIQE